MTPKTLKLSSKYVVPFNNLRESLRPDQDRLEKAFRDTVEDGRFILGPRVEAFEKRFAEYNNLKYGIGVASGTDAITMALAAAGLGEGDIVLTVANSAPPTVCAIKAAGCGVRFADVDHRGLFEPTQLRNKRLIEGVRAVVVVHLYGRIVNIPAMTDACDAAGIAIIEDAAQAAGSVCNDYAIGSRSLAACFSFYPTKNLGCLGDGGMVLTNSEVIANRVKIARNYGIIDGKQVFYADNSRLDEVQAAFLDVRLDSLEKVNENRRQLSIHYRRGLDKMKYVRPSEVLRGENCHLYTIHCDEREHLQKYLDAQGIQTMIHYPIPAHKMPVEKANFYSNSLVNTEDHCRTVLSLPCWYGMKDLQADIVIRAIRKFYHE